MNPPPITGSPTGSSNRSQGTPWASAIPIFVTVFLIVMIIATAITFILPESYASTAKVRTPASDDPLTIQTELEVIGSQRILDKVVETLNLNVEWGKKYFNGETLKTAESVEILKGRLSLAPVRNTRVIAITVYSDDRHEAATIANGIAGGYQDYVFNQEKAKISKPLDPRIIADPTVIVIDEAQRAARPSKPNKPLNIALGAVMGIILGGMAAGLVCLIGRRR